MIFVRAGKPLANPDSELAKPFNNLLEQVKKVAELCPKCINDNHGLYNPVCQHCDDFCNFIEKEYGGDMKIIVNWSLYTDGDFYLENRERYGGVPDEEYSDTYKGIRIFENKNKLSCMIEARDYLEKMLCDMRVLSGHYYILKYLYDIFDPLICFVCACEPGVLCKELHGNYEGTRISIDILE